MSDLSKLEDRITKLEAASAQIKAATRTAHEATKALRQVQKEVRDLLTTEARDLFDEAVAETVRAGLAGYAEEIRTHTDSAIAQVGRTFDELAAIYLGADKGQQSLPQLAEARKRARENGR